MNAPTKILNVMFVDIATAFDSIDTVHLWEKTEKTNIDKRLWSLIWDLYSDTETLGFPNQ